MTNKISPEIFDHLVMLAALELSPDEAEYLRSQLNNQLKAVQELEAIPLDQQFEITSHGVHYTPEISPSRRKDEWIPYSNKDEILTQVPETQDNYIVVPEIPHTDLT